MRTLLGSCSLKALDLIWERVMPVALTWVSKVSWEPALARESAMALSINSVVLARSASVAFWVRILPRIMCCRRLERRERALILGDGLALGGGAGAVGDEEVVQFGAHDFKALTLCDDGVGMQDAVGVGGGAECGLQESEGKGQGYGGARRRNVLSIVMLFEG